MNNRPASRFEYLSPLLAKISYCSKIQQPSAQICKPNLVALAFNRTGEVTNDVSKLFTYDRVECKVCVKTEPSEVVESDLQKAMDAVGLEVRELFFEFVISAFDHS